MGSTESHRSDAGESPVKEVRVSFKITRSFDLNILNTDTIGSVKDMICKIEGTSVDQQSLSFEGTRMLDTNIVSDYVNSSDSIIDVYVDGGMQIFIVIPSMDKTLPLNVKYMDTIYRLKVMIQDEVGFSLNKQAVVISGKIPKDDEVLIDCGVRNNSTLYVMLNPPAIIHLHVIMSCGKSLNLDAVVGWTTRDAKIIIQSLTGIHINQQKLLHDELELEDCFTLQFYKLQQNSVLYLQVQMQIFVKIDNGKTITITVEDGDTVDLITTKIASKIDLKKGTFLLKYAGKVLQEQKTLAFYGIKKESTIFLLHRVPHDRDNHLILIILQIDDSDSIPLHIGNQATVADLKKMIQEISRTKFKKMQLSRKEDGAELKEDNLTLAHYKLKSNSVVCLNSS